MPAKKKKGSGGSVGGNIGEKRGEEGQESGGKKLTGGKTPKNPL